MVYFQYTMTTTIKIKEKVKSMLDEYKSESESYSDTIQKLLQKLKKTSIKEQLIEGYKSIDKEQMKEFEEWESANL